MDVIEAIKSRKSIRGYKPDPVSKEVIKEILDVATRAPSTQNIQPWEFTVIAGEIMGEIKQANEEKFSSGEAPHRDIGRAMAPYAGEFRERQVGIAVQLFQLMNIGKEDKEKRTEWMKRGFRFFDAPAAIVISIDESMSEAQQINIGSVAQTITLAALNYGLGTCIHDQGAMYPEVIRQFTGIPESKRISICVSIGYPDWDFPANNVQSEREPIENITTWCGL